MPLTEEEITALQAENAKIKADLEALKAKPAPTPEPKKEEEKDLVDKVKEDDKTKADEAGKSKSLEAALTFNIKAASFLKDHETVLPKEAADIFAAAERESYDNAIAKANATKASLIKSFFSVQANMDLTTATQRSAVEDFLKLTNRGREEKADEIFRNVFEPTVEMIKRLKKAEEVGKAKSGIAEHSDGDKAYADKLMKLSRRHFLGEKE